MKQSKKKLKFYKIDNKLLKAPLSLYIGDKDLYNKRMVELGFDDCQIDHQDGNIWFDKKLVVIWFPHLNNTGVIIHELLHYCFDIYGKKGIPINRENDELMAYMLEYMFNEVMKLKRL